MKYFINNRISSYMVFSGIFIFGIIGLSRLPVSLMPEASYPALSIIIEYPGVAPKKIEEMITKPVEEIVKTVSGIEKVQSISEEGKSRVNVSFKIDTDIKITAAKVRNKIDLIREYFPKEVQEPVVLRFDPSDKPVMIVTVDSKKMKLNELRDYTERKIKPILQRIDGVSEINIAGGRQKEIHIDIDKGKFFARSLNFNSIFNIVQSNNTFLPGGVIESRGKEYIVTSPSRYTSIDEISESIIGTSENGGIIYVKDVASVSYGFREQEDIARLNGKERVIIYIHKAGDANALSVCQEAEKYLKTFDNIKTEIIFNQGDYISSAINNVIVSGLWGGFIIIIVLGLFLQRPEPVFAISLSIPISIVTVFALMYFTNTGLNVMSLSGLALGAGMVVDNGIVISEVVFRDKIISQQSIVDAVSSVKRAIVSSTLTTIIVFFPVVFSTEYTKRTYGDLAYTVSAALFASLFVAIILIPSIYVGLGNRKTEGFFSKFELRFKRLKYWYSVIIVKVTNVEKRVVTLYSEIIDYSFQNQKKIISGLLLVVCISLIMFTLIKKELVDPGEAREFYVYLEFPTGTSLLHTDKAVKKVEEYIKTLKGIKKVSTKVEKWRGTLSVKLYEENVSGNDEEDIKKDIKITSNKILKEFHGFTFISGLDEVSSRELSLTFLGNENKRLRNLAKHSAKLVASIKGVEDCVLRFREGRPEYIIEVDRQKAEWSQLSSSDVANYLRNALFGPVATKFVQNDREVDVRIRYRKNDTDTIKKLSQSSIINSQGQSIPVSEVVNIHEKLGSTKIWRHNGRRCVTITAKIGKLTYEEAERKIKKSLSKIKFPDEYSYEFDENIKKMKENNKSMAIAIVLAIILVYMLLASLFESLIIPVIIMITVPLSMLGVIFILFITSSTINISVYIGVIVLAGIVVNNAIILVNEINNDNRAGKINTGNLVDTIKAVCMHRFRPVIITTLTTVLGLTPMLFKSGQGSNLWRPLSMTIISGLIFSTLLTLVIVPLFSEFIFMKKMQR